jgi:hypothetical protein
MRLFSPSLSRSRWMLIAAATALVGAATSLAVIAPGTPGRHGAVVQIQAN